MFLHLLRSFHGYFLLSWVTPLLVHKKSSSWVDCGKMTRDLCGVANILPCIDFFPISWFLFLFFIIITGNDEILLKKGFPSTHVVYYGMQRIKRRYISLRTPPFILSRGLWGSDDKHEVFAMNYYLINYFSYLIFSFVAIISSSHQLHMHGRMLWIWEDFIFHWFWKSFKYLQ